MENDVLITFRIIIDTKMNKIEIKEGKIFLNGTPFFPIGTGYYPRSTTYYLEEADFVEVEEDIKKMKELGYNIVLIFIPWPEIESIKGEYRLFSLRKNNNVQAFNQYCR